MRFNTEVFYPEESVHKIFSAESPGQKPLSVSITIPSVTGVDEPFTVKTAVLDKNGYPSLECSETLVFTNCLTGETMPVRFKKGTPAVAFIKNARNSRKGFFRFSAELDGKLFHSNPSLAEKTPRYRLFWGDPHVHTVLSDCHADIARSVHFACTAGRYLTGLDWMAIADHVSNGRSSPGKWHEGIAVTNLYRAPSEFVILPAYEASLKGGSGGDNNVYCTKYPDIFVDDYEEGNVKTLCEKLMQKAKEQGFDFFVVPHHTSRTGKHGEMPEAIYPGRELMPAIEIYSKWGCSEYPGNPRPLLNPYNGKVYVLDYLKRGVCTGFVAGTDSHATMPSGAGLEAPHIPYPPGFTAVRSGELTDMAVFKAIREGNTYAASGERIFLEAKINGLVHGGVIRDSRVPSRKVSVTAAATERIEKMELIRNGDVIYSSVVNDWHGSMEFTDEEKMDRYYMESEYGGRFLFYYVRLSCFSGAQAWSSPVFFLQP